MSAHTEATLAALLPTSPYLLAYTLPLLFPSLLLTFAGAFLTLDRTRAFAPRYDALKPSETTNIQHAEVLLRKVFRLEGGVGGLALGFVTGVHLTTFLSLLIPNVSASKPLSAGAFVAVWLLSGIACAILAARWRFLTLTFAGIVGYSTCAIALSVIIHPSLLARLVLVAIFTPIGTIMCLLPIARTQHVFMRAALASAGAFGTVHSIALFANVASWIEVWDRLWVHDGNNWGTGTEKGLSAAYCLFLAVGSASDWFLRRKLGENPDEKWDSYLADYAATLPNASDRAGHFQPLQSFWGRHFGHDKRMDPIGKDTVFPTDADLKAPIPESPLRLYKKRSVAGPRAQHGEQTRRFTPPQDLLRKGSRPAVKGRQRTREIIKFDPFDPYTLSDSDDEGLKKGSPPFLRSSTRSDSMATLTDDHPFSVKGAKGVPLAKKVKQDPLSDDEQDVTANRSPAVHGERWTPDFFQRLAHKPSSAALSQAGTGSSNTLTPANFTPVPATPSLIKAVERVTAAQQEAFRHTDGLPPSSSVPSTPGERPPQPKAHNWDAFWHDVKTKAGHGFQHTPEGTGAAR